MTGFFFLVTPIRITKGNPATPTKEKAWHKSAGLCAARQFRKYHLFFLWTIHLFTKHTGEKFTNHEIKIENDDIYYMLSDGYASQFGGTKEKKFMRKNLQELILSIQNLTMSEQREIFNNSIEEWKNAIGKEQTDDILILGFKIT